MKLICVYGAVNDNIGDIYIQSAYNFGKRMAQEGYGLVYSGMKGGISGAVSKGILDVNNSLPIIGIMPEFFKEIKQDEIYEGCTEKIFTDDISKRKGIMKEKADAIVVMPGGVGTFDELFDAICTKRWGFMDKPIVIYNIDNYYNSLIEMLNYSIKVNFGKENYNDTYKVFDNIDDIFNYINNYNKE